MANERLKDFPAKPVPVSADIIYVGDSADSFNEVQSTIGQIFAGYSAALVSLAGLSSAANQMPYYSGTNTFAVTNLTAFARTFLDDANGAAVCTTIGALPLTGGTLTGNLTLVGDPSTALMAATKQYVDSQGGQPTCKVATTGALTATYANGTAGVGATLTNAGANAALTIDGVLQVADNRVLVKDQGTTFQNGIYTVTIVGDGSTPWVLTRAGDYDTVAEIQQGDEVGVAQGTVNARTQWLETAVVATIGTDPITFQSNVVAGSNITKTNNSIAVTAGVFLLLAGGTMAGAINMGGFAITNMLDPVSDQDAATKVYVDNVAQGKTFKDPAAAASTVALTATYANGVSGVGATLTNAGVQAAFAIDGYTAALNDRILIKDQAATLQNGLYSVTVLGSGVTNWVLTRTTDMDTASQFAGATVFILNGTINQGRTYTESATVSAVGTDPVTFVQTGDATGGTVTDVSVVTANGFSGSVATSTTTPAITINANPAQFAAAPSTVSNVTGDNTAYTIIWNNADLNAGTMLNTSTGVWTIPLAGLYCLSGVLSLTGLDASHTQLSLTMTGATSSVSGQILDLNAAAIKDGGTLIIPFSYNFYSTAAATNSLSLTVAGSGKTVDVVNTSYVGLSLLR